MQALTTRSYAEHIRFLAEYRTEIKQLMSRQSSDRACDANLIIPVKEAWKTSLPRMNDSHCNCPHKAPVENIHTFPGSKAIELFVSHSRAPCYYARSVCYVAQILDLAGVRTNLQACTKYAHERYSLSLASGGLAFRYHISFFCNCKTRIWFEIFSADIALTKMTF